MDSSSSREWKHCFIRISVCAEHDLQEASRVLVSVYEQDAHEFFLQVVDPETRDLTQRHEHSILILLQLSELIIGYHIRVGL